MSAELVPEYDGEWFVVLGDLTVAAGSLRALSMELDLLLGFGCYRLTGYYPGGFESPPWPVAEGRPGFTLNRKMGHSIAGISWAKGMVSVGVAGDARKGNGRKLFSADEAKTEAILSGWAAGKRARELAAEVGWPGDSKGAERVKALVKRLRGSDPRAVARGPGGRAL